MTIPRQRRQLSISGKLFRIGDPVPYKNNVGSHRISPFTPPTNPADDCGRGLVHQPILASAPKYWLISPYKVAVGSSDHVANPPATSCAKKLQAAPTIPQKREPADIFHGNAIFSCIEIQKMHQ
jgi:hypothetical protein